MAFSNSGTVDVETGTLSLQGGGTIGAGAAFTGAGFTRFYGLAGGTMTINGAATGSNLALDAGTLTGAGDLSVSNEFDWTGGTLSGTGKLILDTNAQMNLTGATTTMTGGNRPVDTTAAGAAVNWTGGTLAGTFANQGSFNLGGSAAKTLSGTVNQSGPGSGSGVWNGTGYLYMTNGAAFNNLAGSTINVQSPLNIVSSSPSTGTAPVFTNAGTFRQTVTTGTTTFGTYYGYTYVAFSNSGTVDVETGTVSLQGGGTIGAGAAFTGAGITRFYSVSGGTMTVNGAATASNLAFDAGTLTGPGDLTVTKEFDWTGGTLSGTGKLILGTNAQMNLTGATTTMTGGNRPVDTTAAGAAVNWTGGTLAGTFADQGSFSLGGTATKTLSGTVNQSGPGSGVWNGTGYLYMTNGAAFNNLAGSTINVQSPLNIVSSSPSTGTAPVFTNAGTFRQTVTTSTTTFGTYYGYTYVAFSNSGTVDIQTGTVNLALEPSPTSRARP